MSEATVDVRPRVDAPSFLETLRPALLLLTAATACAFAGFRLSHPGIPTTYEWWSLAHYLVLLLPIFLNRQLLYESRDVEAIRGDVVASWLRQLSYYVLLAPVIAVTLLWILAALIAMSAGWFQTMSSPADLTPHANAFAWITASLIPLAVLMPFYAFAMWVTSKWPAGEILYFRFRSVVPAFLTCTMSFVMGTVGPGAWRGAFLAGPLLLGLWYLLAGFKRQWIIVVATTIMLATTTLVLGLQPVGEGAGWKYSAQLALFAYILAALMTVCESWRVWAMSIQADHPATHYRLPENAPSYMAVANAATSAIPPLFLLTYLHPAAGAAYFGTAAVFCVGMCVVWYELRERIGRLYRRWVWIAVTMGLSAPVAVAVTVRVGIRLGDQAHLVSASTPNFWPASTIVFTAMVFWIGAHARLRTEDRAVLEFLIKRQWPELEARQRGLLLAGYVCLLLTALVGLGPLWAVVVGAVQGQPIQGVPLYLAGKAVPLVYAFFVGGIIGYVRSGALSK